MRNASLTFSSGKNQQLLSTKIYLVTTGLTKYSS